MSSHRPVPAFEDIYAERSDGLDNYMNVDTSNQVVENLRGQCLNTKSSVVAIII